MSVELISQDFSDRFDELLSATKSTIKIISPFIGLRTATRLAEYLEENKHIQCQIITRFYREDFIRRVSSLDGLYKLFRSGTEILALKKLHSKLYVFDTNSAIVGSANFTTGGFSTNHELSILLDSEETVAEECNMYFDELYNRVKEAGDGEVTQQWFEEEIKYVSKAGKNLDKNSKPNIKKRGANISFEPGEQDISKVCYPVKNIDIIEENLTLKNIQSDSNVFLKFIGKSSDRRNGDERYITTKLKDDQKKIYFHIRPRAFKDNAIMYIVALSYDNKGRPSPMILGRAITYGFDIANEATEEEKKRTIGKENILII